MSSSSDSGPAPRAKPSLSHAQEQQPEGKRISRYDIYGSATKPFGEGYRRSQAQEREDSPPLDADSVEEAMGCRESRPEVATNQETVKGNFKDQEVEEQRVEPAEVGERSNKEVQGATDYDQITYENKEEISETVWEKARNKECKENTKLSDYEIVYGKRKERMLDNDSEDNKYYKGKPTKLSDYEIIYGKKKDESSISDGYCKVAIYSEVRKPEKIQVTEDKESKPQTPREMLMQQIRDRKDDDKLPKDDVCLIKRHVNENMGEEECKDRSIRCKEEIFSIPLTNQENKPLSSFANVAPVSFVEEEYSYEPENKEATSKLVVRSRSVANLDPNQVNFNGTTCTLKRPNALKMTTKPDGTIRYGLRRGSSESDLLDADGPQQLAEVKINYVNSIKSAFDAAIEKHAQEQVGKAEAFDGLRQYFHDNKHGLQELLVNNNVVIIEPYRPDPPRSPGSEKSETGSQRTCRITGATIKSPVTEQKKVIPASNTLPRRNKSRQGFYHPIKVNKELIDAELPDPDKVKSARELFENVLKSKSGAEIPTKTSQTKSFFNTLTNKMKMRFTPEVKVIQENRQLTNDKKREGRLTIDHLMREDVRRYPPQRRWTDSGSLSSGVSSDFSCDQDCDFHMNDSSTSQDILEEYSSDDAEYNYPYDDDEGHPVSMDVLQKIRACGTTVTYYGGKVISRSHGQARSPMTMTIMDEIRQNVGAKEGRKKFESDREEPYLGVKFRLVKSHSCGSRLEIAGTDEELVRHKHDSFINESIAEETNEAKDGKDEVEDNQPTSLEEDESDKVEADRYEEVKNRPVMTWAELKLKEARKQWHCAPEAVRTPPQDMEFETFEVLDEATAHKCEKVETGRG